MGNFQSLLPPLLLSEFSIILPLSTMNPETNYQRQQEHTNHNPLDKEGE